MCPVQKPHTLTPHTVVTYQCAGLHRVIADLVAQPCGVQFIGLFKKLHTTLLRMHKLVTHQTVSWDSISNWVVANQVMWRAIVAGLQAKHNQPKPAADEQPKGHYFWPPHCTFWIHLQFSSCLFLSRFQNIEGLCFLGGWQTQVVTRWRKTMSWPPERRDWGLSKAQQVASGATVGGVWSCTATTAHSLHCKVLKL